MGFFSWLFDQPIRSSEPSPPKETEIVFAILNPQFHGNNETGIIIGSNNAQTIAEDRALIARYRAWLKTQPPNIVRAYEHWLTYYDEQCNDAESAIKNNARQEHEKRWNQIVTKSNEVQQATKSFPKMQS